VAPALPKDYTLIYDAAAIAARVRLLSAEIDAWAIEVEKRGGGQLLAVCILNGAVFYFADLLRGISCSVQPAFCRAWSYSTEDNSQSGVKVSVDEIEAVGRSILLVDDICDTGATLAQLETVLSNLGAAEVRSAVLVRRELSAPACVPHWSAFEYKGSEWFVGYGMDNKGFHRNLSAVYTLKKPSGD
jgi:hypoxanthine phosphoribosyltransferase